MGAAGGEEAVEPLNRVREVSQDTEHQGVDLALQLDQFSLEEWALFGSRCRCVMPDEIPKKPRRV